MPLFCMDFLHTELHNLLHMLHSHLTVLLRIKGIRIGRQEFLHALEQFYKENVNRLKEQMKKQEKERLDRLRQQIREEQKAYYEHVFLSVVMFLFLL